MRTTISVSVSPNEAKTSRKLAKLRGFESLSEYLRFLLSMDDADLISEEEILTRAKDAKRLYKEGKLIQANSLRELLRKHGV